MSSSHEARAHQLMNDPIGLFDHSITRMNNMPRDELEGLQRTALSLRFQELYDSIEILRKLADRLGITEVNEFDDLVPLLFPHTAFKSYPPALLDRKRFDLMTGWLNKLTRYDLSDLDMEGCDSIDEWIDRLDEQTPLLVITSSGTTGTISLIPRDKASAVYGMKVWRLFLFQTFGKEPTREELDVAVDIVWPRHASGRLGNLRSVPYMIDEFAGGDRSRFHALYPDAISTDMLFLNSKMRAAASRGELDRLEIDPKLMARREEFMAMQARMPQQMTAFLEKCATELAGRRVFMSGTYAMLHEFASAGLERGERHVFAADSAILTGGGMKGFALPEDYMETIQEYLGVDRIHELYGMSEVGVSNWACQSKHYHVPPWCIPFVLDPDTNEALPREGVQTGRAAFFDLLNVSHWSGSISGDEITLDWSTPCPCGLNSVHIHHDIMRYSEKEGVDDDRITCSATQQVNEEAIDFMREFEG